MIGYLVLALTAGNSNRDGISLFRYPVTGVQAVRLLAAVDFGLELYMDRWSSFDTENQTW